VLAGRADPPLPLARLRAQGELLEIRAADLRFTPEEAASYFNGSMGLQLTPADVGALEARTEGWVAALQLAALSMQGRDDTSGFIASFAGDDRFVVDYLAEEVLERQPEEVRLFLLDTAILDRFTGPLCDAVTGRGGGKAMLERLDRANLFLVPLDDRRLWYRYHHLFADVLRARLLDEQPERLGDLHRRASTWYEASGDHPAAIGHAMAAHDVEGAARLIELAAPAMFQSRQELTARRWLTALPDSLFRDRPVLSIMLVAALMVSGETTGVDRLLDSVERWLDPSTGTSANTATAIVFNEAEFARLPAQVAVYRAALALIAGDPASTIRHANRALVLAEPTDHLPRGSAAALLGLALWSGGDLEPARRHYTEALTSLIAAGHISDVLGCSLAVADIQIAQGRLGDAIRTYDAGLELARAHGVIRGTADMHVGLSEVLLERGDVATATQHLDAAVQLGEQAGLPQHPYRWRVAMADIRRAEGDPAGALDLLAEAERLYNTDMSPPVRPVPAIRARAQLACGDIDGARGWAAERGLSADDQLSYLCEYEHLTLARVRLAGAEDPRGTLRFLERLLAAAEEGQRGSAVEILVLLALAHQACGNRVEAPSTLEEALRRAEPERRTRVFLDELPALAPLLRALSAGAAGAHARRVLAAPPTSTIVPGPGLVPLRPGAASPHGLVDELSSRELDVLRLLRGDLSGPEMARELLVSLNTVRTHTKNIYMKLGVNNRREAVRRAAELGL
jgi:LuxR family maltose regulon positive regulatory protein